MGRNTGVLPEGISRYRVFAPLATRFSFARAYELKSDAEKGANRMRDKGYRARVVPIKAKARGVLYKYAVYRKRGRDRDSKASRR